MRALAPDMSGAPERDHDFDRIEERDAGFVLHCQCGWSTAVSRSAAVVGDAWDRHRQEVAAGNLSDDHREAT